MPAPVPNTNESIVDGALGFTDVDTSDLMCAAGVSSAGTVGAIVKYMRPEDVVAALGSGPLVEFLCHALSVARGPILGCRVTGDVAAVSGGVTETGVGPAISYTGTPTDTGSVRIRITKIGARGTATFQISYDAGTTWSASLLTAATVVVGLGLTIDFATGSDYAIDKTASFEVTEPGYSDTAMGVALTAIKNDSNGAALVFLVGSHVVASAAAHATRIAAVQTANAAAFAAHRYYDVLVEAFDCTVDSDASGEIALAAATASTVAPAVSSWAGFGILLSSVSLRAYRRPVAAWCAASRARMVSPSEDLGYVKRGALPAALLSIEIDAAARQTLNDARYGTLMSLVGKTGFFVANPNTMAAVGSDFDLLQARRVINRGLAIARAALLDSLSGKIRVYTSPAPAGKVAGEIIEGDALALEADVNAALLRGLVVKGDAPAAFARIVRGTSNLSSRSISYGISITAFGYTKTITIQIGFTPAS